MSEIFKNKKPLTSYFKETLSCLFTQYSKQVDYAWKSDKITLR